MCIFFIQFFVWFSMYLYGGVHKYNELPQKTRFQSVPIVALCLYNIRHEYLVFIKFSL